MALFDNEEIVEAFVDEETAVVLAWATIDADEEVLDAMLVDELDTLDVVVDGEKPEVSDDVRVIVVVVGMELEDEEEVIAIGAGVNTSVSVWVAFIDICIWLELP